MTRRSRGSPPLNRRHALVTIGGIAAGTVSMAGCLSLRDDDDSTPPALNLDRDELLDVPAADLPEKPAVPPADVSVEHVDAGRNRVTSLLSAVPDDLRAEVPNEAVRSELQELRADAQAELDRSEEEPDSAATLAAIRQARRNAAGAAGMYAAATKNRTREEIFEEGEAVEAELSAFESALSRNGPEPLQTALVYATVEQRLDIARRALGEELDRIAPAAAEVEAVRDASSAVERARAELADATYFHERQPTETTFDDQLHSVADARLDDLDEQVTELPDDPAEFFDTDVENTPAAEAGRLVRTVIADYESAREFLDNGWVAGALRRAYELTLRLQALDGLATAVEDGALSRPTDVAEIRAAREAAVAAVSDRIDDESENALSAHGLVLARQMVGAGDESIEWIRDQSFGLDSSSGERFVFRAFANYVTASELAGAVSEATEAFLSEFD